MGNNQQRAQSRFSDQNKWMSLAQTSRKELIQNKLSRQIVEKHYVKNIQFSQIKHDSIIFQWRKEYKTSFCCVQIFEIKQIREEDQNYCISACQNHQKDTDLIVYTQHIFKLYQQNPKCLLQEKDQLTIFKGIVEGVDLLSKKFGEFVVTKDLVGYNSSKRGKAWVHQNFCINQVQQKRVIRSPDDRIKWEKEVIEALLNLCKLCSIDKNIKNCKFYHVMELIMRNRLYKFSNFRQFGPFKDIDLSQRNSSRDIRKTQQQISSGHLKSTEDKQRYSEKQQKRVKIFSKTFEFPLVKIHQPDRNMTTMDIYHKKNYNVDQNHNISLGGQGKRQQIKQPTQTQPTVHKNNHVQIKNNNNPDNNQTFLHDANDYNRRHRKTYPSRQGKQKHHKRPQHYAILDEMQQSRSSRDSDKMIDKNMIKMVDSWMMVQNKEESDNSKHPYNHKISLEESVIVRVPHNHTRR